MSTLQYGSGGYADTYLQASKSPSECAACATKAQKISRNFHSRGAPSFPSEVIMAETEEEKGLTGTVEKRSLQREAQISSSTHD